MIKFPNFKKGSFVRLSKIIFILAMVISFQSCKDNKNQDVSYYEEVNTYEQQSQLNFKLKCLDSYSCPEYISHLRIGNTSACTGVLIEKDLVLTNKHCLKNLQNKHDCSSIDLYFQKNDKTIKRTCKDIVLKGEVSGSNLENIKDYAILSLDKNLDLEPVQIENGNKLRHRESVTTYVTNSNTYNYATISRIGSCQFLKETIYEKSEDFWFFKNCNIKPGHSGSPILLNGKLMGLFSSRIDPLRNRISGIFQRNLTPNSNIRYGMGFNVDCIPHGNFQSKNCSISNNRDSKIDKVTTLYLESLKPFNNIINDDYIIWKYDLSTLETTPMCVKNVDHLDLVISDNNSLFENIRGKKVYDYQNSFKGFKPELFINNDLQFEIRMKKENSIYFSQISIDLKDLEEEGHAQITFSEQILSSFQKKRVSVPVCSEISDELNLFSTIL